MPAVCGAFAGVWASFASALVPAALSGSGSAPSPSRAESTRISVVVLALSLIAVHVAVRDVLGRVRDTIAPSAAYGAATFKIG